MAGPRQAGRAGHRRHRAAAGVSRQRPAGRHVGGGGVAVSPPLGRAACLPAEGGRAVVFTNNDDAYDDGARSAGGGCPTSPSSIVHRPMPGKLIAACAAGRRDAQRMPSSSMCAAHRRVHAVRIAAMNDPAVAREIDTLRPGRRLRRLDADDPSAQPVGRQSSLRQVLGAFLPDRVTQAQRSIGAARGRWISAMPCGWPCCRDCRCRGLRRCSESERLHRRRAEAQHQMPPLLAGGPAEVAAVGRLPERRHRQGRRAGGARELRLGRASEALHHARHGDRPGQDQQPQRPASWRQATGRSIPEVGTTTFRPPYTPVLDGRITGRRSPRLHAPAGRACRHTGAHRVRCGVRRLRRLVAARHLSRGRRGRSGGDRARGAVGAPGRRAVRRLARSARSRSAAPTRRASSIACTTTSWSPEAGQAALLPAAQRRPARCSTTAWSRGSPRTAICSRPRRATPPASWRCWRNGTRASDRA